MRCMCNYALMTHRPTRSGRSLTKCESDCLCKHRAFGFFVCLQYPFHTRTHTCTLIPCVFRLYVTSSSFPFFHFFFGVPYVFLCFKVFTSGWRAQACKSRRAGTSPPLWLRARSRSNGCIGVIGVVIYSQKIRFWCTHALYCVWCIRECVVGKSVSIYKYTIPFF